MVAPMMAAELDRVPVKVLELESQLLYFGEEPFPWDVELEFPAYIWQTWKYLHALEILREDLSQ